MAGKGNTEWVKGVSGNPAGKPKGTLNKATTEFRNAVADLINHNSAHLQAWLEQIATDNPEKAVDMMCKLAEYAAPKLARQEVQQLDKDGEPTDNTLKIEIIKARNEVTDN